MRYNEALAVLSLARDNLLQLPIGINNPRDTSEYREAISTIGGLCESGVLAFHYALQRSGSPVTSYVI